MKALFITLSLFIGTAFACSCEEWGTAAEILADADTVFVGNFASARSVRGGAEYNLKTTMKITKAFKPKPSRSKKIVVRSERNTGANCGTSFERGGKYLILGYKDEAGNVYTDSCSYRDIESGDTEMTALLAALEAASSSK